ncbi:hypothetical protein [Dokdonella sp.]|uniref:hypothetical protein n=1 Tax=Dokdonella sp. TaxID=2291710 RepID=UPI001B261F4E|nr:hypothetical protein [Dokdonella sp.]MBO9665138.1 hypothetical protein [Dokdonella sp.]
MRRHARIGFIALTAALAAACGKKADNDAPLAFVPADTPYVIAALEPIPEATAKHLTAQAQSVWSAIFPMFDQLLADTGQLKDEDATPEQVAEHAKVRRVLKAVLDEIRGRDTPEKWREVGLGTQVRSALYGVGLLPVLRAEILDADALRAMIARVEQNAGEKLATARVGEQDVWTIGSAPLLGLVAIEGKHLVVTVVPSGADDATKRRVLGLDRPAQSLADTDALAAFNKARGYLPYGSGWIDTRRLLALLNDDPAVEAIAKAADEPKPVLDATCRGEFDAIAAKAPRLALGYTKFDAERMTMHMRLDLDPTLAKALAALPGALPGSNSGDALFEIAFALPVLRGRDFLVAQADAIAAAPFKCEALQPLNAEFADMKTKIEQMIPPPLADLVGVRLTLDSLVLPDANDSEKFDVSGRVLIGSNNPTFLTGLAQMSVPALQKITLTPDGKAVAIPSDVVPGGYAEGREIHAAMGAKALGLAIGKDQTAKLETAVTASAATSGTIIDSNVSGSVYKLLGDAFALFGDKLPDKDRAGIDMQRKLYAMYAQWFKRVGGGMSFGPEGIDITQDVEYAKQ